MNWKVIPVMLTIILMILITYHLVTTQKCVKERCHDIVHPIVYHAEVPEHEDLQPYYDFFSKRWGIHSVRIATRPAYQDPAWTEIQCECVCYGVSIYDKWRQR